MSNSDGGAGREHPGTREARTITPWSGLADLRWGRREALAAAGVVGVVVGGVATLRGVEEWRREKPVAPLGGPQPISTLPIDIGYPQAANERNRTVLAVAPDGDLFAGRFGGRQLVHSTPDGRMSFISVGSSDGSVAVADDGTAFATDAEDRTISVIRDDAVTARLKSPNEPPMDVATGPDGSAFVTTETSVLVVQDDQLVTTVELGPGGVGNSGTNAIAVSPDGTVYVGEFKKRTVTVIKAGQVRARINLPSPPSQLGITSSGRVFAAMGGPECKVAVIDDLALTTVLRLSKSESKTPRLAVAPDDTVYVGFYWNQSSSQLAVIRDTTVEFQAPVSPPLALATAPDNTLYLATVDRIEVMR